MWTEEKKERKALCWRNHFVTATISTASWNKSDLWHQMQMSQMHQSNKPIFNIRKLKNSINGEKYESSFSNHFQRALMKLKPPVSTATLCKMVEIRKKEKIEQN